MATGPEAGWYDDGSGKQRWWDGTRWSEHYVDLGEREIALHAGATPAGAPASAGWYDDGRGRRRWWDGARWTAASRFSGSEESFAGIVVDGRWIHFGAESQPVAGASASYESGAELVRRGRLSGPANARVLHGPSGLITPRLLPRSVHSAGSYLLVEVAGQVWLAAGPPGYDAAGRQFATWINTVSQHYLYR
ncbi:Protein of unknown function [Microbacterium sp. cf046]|uniref:DUF2510 domain-containing protein n=1 Tax=Microbacterium sp. cf046 TaxID=1761803 RepID=UPI0008E0D74A|nr:DUF2510 domain-containing protein [Microbacterium sp. cf046]SFS03777.1 Protein of unknown function [Microbacterium sp. cf046]